MAENAGWIEAIMHNKMAAFLTEAFEEERTKPWRTFLSHRLKYFRGFFSRSCYNQQTTGPLAVVSWGKNLNQSGRSIVVFLLLAVYFGQKSSCWANETWKCWRIWVLEKFHTSWKLNGEISKWKNWDDDSVLSVTLTHHASQQLTGRLWLLCCITTWPNSAMNYDLINYRIWMLSLTKIELYGQLFRYYWMFDCLQTDCGVERVFIFFGEICANYCGCDDPPL